MRWNSFAWFELVGGFMIVLAPVVIYGFAWRAHNKTSVIWGIVSLNHS